MGIVEKNSFSTVKLHTVNPTKLLYNYHLNCCTKHLPDALLAIKEIVSSVWVWRLARTNVNVRVPHYVATQTTEAAWEQVITPLWWNIITHSSAHQHHLSCWAPPHTQSAPHQGQLHPHMPSVSSSGTGLQDAAHLFARPSVSITASFRMWCL